jgi:hypothetical protein
MLDFAQQAETPSLRLLVVHDDDAREFAYMKGAEQAMARADDEHWLTVSMREDWATVFPSARR